MVTKVEARRSVINQTIDCKVEAKYYPCDKPDSHGPNCLRPNPSIQIGPNQEVQYIVIGHHKPKMGEFEFRSMPKGKNKDATPVLYWVFVLQPIISI